MEREGLSEEKRKALRRSKFAPLSSPLPPLRRLAHPGGPLKTNKAAALAKFLERKLQEPNGLASMNPQLVELAVKNAKDTVNASKSGISKSGTTVQHVNSFGDSEDSCEAKKITNSESMKEKKKRKKKMKKKDKKKNKQKILENTLNATLKRPKKKLKL